MIAPAAFRHDPVRLVLPTQASHGAIRWAKEPSVSAYRRFVFRSAMKGEVPVPICATPVVIPGVGIVVASYDGFVRLLDPALGQFYWEHRLRGGIYAPLVADPVRKRIFASTINGGIACLDLRGNCIWTREIGAPIHAAPILGGGGEVLAICAFGGLCLGLEVATGRTVFQRPLPRPWYTAANAIASHRDPYASPVGTPDGGFILCCAEEALSIAADGSLRWQRGINAGIRASPAYVAGTCEVLLCAVDGSCHFLDAVSGRTTGTLSLASKIVASPAASGEILAVGTADDRIHGLCAVRRERIWTHHFGAPKDHGSVSLLPDGSFVAVRSNGNIVARRAEDGEFLWETGQQIGVPDLTVALDTTPVSGTDGHMYCGNYAGDLYAFVFDRQAATGACA